MASSFGHDRVAKQLDAFAEVAQSRQIPVKAKLAIEEAASLLSAEKLVTPEAPDLKPFVVSITLPKNLAKKFPPPEENKGHPPHVTLLYIPGQEGMTPGMTDEVISLLRKLAKRLPTFRCQITAHRGLEDFGETESGTKALWFGVRDDPNGQLPKLHNFLNQQVSLLGVDCTQNHSFQPHCTWSYVPNDQSEKDRQRISSLASNRFVDASTWFEVRQLTVTTPAGKTTTIALANNLRKS